MELFILMKFVIFLETQAKLINVIQDQSFYKYGSNKKIKIDIRVIAGTTYDPNEAVKNGILREDLYYDYL